MTGDWNVHSFDRPRDRAAPKTLRGHWSQGDAASIVLVELTLVVAIKPRCDGCREFVTGSLDELDGVNVVLVSSIDDDGGEWAHAQRPILVAPEALKALGVGGPPFYVLVDPATGRVVTEGVVYGSAQVAEEVAPFIRR